MQKFKQFSITALVILSLLLFFTTISLALDVSGNTTHITISIIGNITGNKGLNDTTTNTNYDSCIPAAGSLDKVIKNKVVIGDSNLSNITVTGRVYGGYNRGDGDVSENDVSISNATVTNLVYGGYTFGLGDVTKNEVIIFSDGIANYWALGGYTSGLGNVTENLITVDGEVKSVVYGGQIDKFDSTAAVNNNEVIITGKVTSGAYGGHTSGLGEVVGNEVTVSGTVGYDIYGGYISNSSSTATASDNVVTIEHTGEVKGIYGANTFGSGTVTLNKVYIYGKAKVPNGATRIFGGRSAGGSATYNEVHINGMVGDSTELYIAQVYGGTASLAANNNSINIVAGATVIANVFGGSANGDAKGNKVEISGTVVSLDNNDLTKTSNIYGGYSDNGLVTDNVVIVYSDGVVHNITGGGTVTKGDVINNTATIYANATATGSVYGGYGAVTSSGTVRDNLLIVNGKAETIAFGGYTLGLGAVTGNSVTIGGRVDIQVTGGYVNNTSNITTVSDNIVTITGIVGAAPGQGDVYGGRTTGSGAVNNNTVTISGTVYNAVYGGFTDGIGSVSLNTVTIESTAILTTASLWGSNISGVSGTGNTLNVNGFFGEIDTMGNFEYYNFVLGALNNQTFIEITGAPVNIDDSHISIDFGAAFFSNTINASNPTIKVISSITATASPLSVTVTSSPFVAYDYIATYDTGALLLTITSANLKDETSFVGEGFAAGLAFLGQAADVRSSIYFAPQDSRFIPFAKMIYGKQYISTGSSVNVKGFSAIAGLALNTNFDNGSQLVVGAFVEGGWGDYNSRHSFSNSSVNGKGDTEYYGGGVLARYVLKSGLYGEGTFAAGKTETDFRTYDYVPGIRSKYDYSVPYYSAHVSVGKLFKMYDIFSLDLYGKYLWTRQAGENITMDGYRFKFKAADSHRVRAGGKLTADVLPQLQPYVGAAYEYEFSGRIKGSLSGMNLDKPSLRGGTGIGELGLVWTPNESGNFKVDLGAQGYVGKREGVSGGLTVTMSF